MLDTPVIITYSLRARNHYAEWLEVLRRSGRSRRGFIVWLQILSTLLDGGVLITTDNRILSTECIEEVSTDEEVPFPRFRSKGHHFRQTGAPERRLWARPGWRP